MNERIRNKKGIDFKINRKVVNYLPSKDQGSQVGVLEGCCLGQVLPFQGSSQCT